MKKYISSIVITLGISIFSYSQLAKHDSLFETYQVDSLPKLIVDGRQVKLEEFILEKMTWQSSMIEGEKIVLSYYVDTKGYIRCIEVLEMPKACELCTKEFLKVITSLPDLTPGMKSGVAVSVKQMMVFHFKIKR